MHTEKITYIFLSLLQLNTNGIFFTFFITSSIEY